MNEESKTPNPSEDAGQDMPEEEPVDNVVDEILKTVGGMNAMLDALDKSRPHLQEAGKVFLSALAKATEEARHTAEAAQDSVDADGDVGAKKGAELAARLFGVIDKVAQVAVPSGQSDPDAEELEESVATRAADMGARLAGAFNHALEATVEKLKREAAADTDGEQGATGEADEPEDR
jgi:hypothetical protein